MVAIADKDKAHREGFFALDDSGLHTQQILRAATPLSVLLVDRLHILQELKHHLGCPLLGKFSLLAAIGTSVHFP